MGKSCFDGYLTEGCKTCNDWKDGTGPTGMIGCGCNFPIMMCKSFAEMVEKDRDIPLKEELEEIDRQFYQNSL